MRDNLANSKIKKNISFMNWLIEVAEEKIIEHRLLKQKFNSHEEFIIFTIIWMRVYKNLVKKMKNLNLQNQIKLSNSSIEQFIKDYYTNQNDGYLGMTINGVTRESNVPRTTVKRIIEILIKKKLLKRNENRLIIPRSQVRDLMKDYRQYIFQSNKRLYSLFDELNLKELYKDMDIL